MTDFSTYEAFSKKIHVSFSDITLLFRAFIHRSSLNENKDLTEHNERLEFLGDAVLELVTTDYLYRNFQKQEGELTNLRSAIVKRETLALTARDLGMGDLLFLSKGEEGSGGREKDYILANTVEALIGAIYIDQGYQVAEQFILKYIVSKLDNILKENLHIDAKTFFQEKSQEVLGITPEYKLIYTEGPDHKKIFTMGLYLEDEYIAQGKGTSKQIAEQNAAREGITIKGWDEK